MTIILRLKWCDQYQTSKSVSLSEEKKIFIHIDLRVCFLYYYYFLSFSVKYNKIQSFKQPWVLANNLRSHILISLIETRSGLTYSFFVACHWICQIKGYFHARVSIWFYKRPTKLSTLDSFELAGWFVFFFKHTHTRVNFIVY